jgi:hypothetical protein
MPRIDRVNSDNSEGIGAYCKEIAYYLHAYALDCARYHNQDWYQVIFEALDAEEYRLYDLGYRMYAEYDVMKWIDCE